MDFMAAALVVTDEVALPIRAVGDLAAAAEVSREEVAVITKFAALGELAASCPLFISFTFLRRSRASSFVCDAGTR